VSSLGRVKNIKRGKIRKIFPYTNGYYRVVLTRNQKQTILAVHRIVAQEFIGLSDKPQVNHKDGDKSNNAVSNLEWVTREENVKHAIDTGLWSPVGEDNHMAKLTLSNVHWVKYLLGQGAVGARLAKVFGVQPAAISKINVGRSWAHV
jgi:hypothetical protein